MAERLNRFQWLKSVLRDKTLNASAKATASALAVQFCCDATGQLNPRATTLAEFLGVSLATVKRAISDLIKGGWLHRTEGRGAGMQTHYSLIAPCQIVPFRARKTPPNPERQPPKKPQIEAKKTGSITSFQRRKHGSNSSFHRLKFEPSYINNPKNKKRTEEIDMFSKPLTAIFIAASETAKIREWNAALADEGLPPVQQLGCSTTQRGVFGYVLPSNWPPAKPWEVQGDRADQAERDRSAMLRYVAHCQAKLDACEVRYAGE